MVILREAYREESQELNSVVPFFPYHVVKNDIRRDKARLTACRAPTQQQVNSSSQITGQGRIQDARW